MKTTIVVAYDQNRGIGQNGSIPWHLRGEMAWLATFTKTRQDPASGENALIMGRLTWDSLPRKPLPEREHLVISRSWQTPETGCTLYRHLTDALDTLAKRGNIENAFIFGGAQIYREALSLDRVSHIVATEVPGQYHCDTFFPEVSADRFRLDNEEAVAYGEHIVKRKYYSATRA